MPLKQNIVLKGYDISRANRELTANKTNTHSFVLILSLVPLTLKVT